MKVDWIWVRVLTHAIGTNLTQFLDLFNFYYLNIYYLISFFVYQFRYEKLSENKFIVSYKIALLKLRLGEEHECKLSESLATCYFHLARQLDIYCYGVYLGESGQSDPSIFRVDFLDILVFIFNLKPQFTQIF